MRTFGGPFFNNRDALGDPMGNYSSDTNPNNWTDDEMTDLTGAQETEQNVVHKLQLKKED